ncbi:hypothetical protein KBB96_18125 [Luteolibacter ambystomatis]|uniref:Uncharacterized protein n=1 Tax=Luteolibacter ambystomatis TaxID=2824561 RepID=A0A975G8K8_9BACT|nr:hypothetical protein [Luteolibacter ambystomatis]QUE50766.1 hypothetical protein KBB96_18125 [Luteolibacter ambystomatis]
MKAVWIFAIFWVAALGYWVFRFFSQVDYLTTGFAGGRVPDSAISLKLQLLSVVSLSLLVGCLIGRNTGSRGPK